MPVRTNREYRAMTCLEVRAAGQEEYIVEGYATTFNERYLLWSDGETEYFEQVDARAFDGADMSDVILQYDHEGRVFARISNGTLKLTVDKHGLHVWADLSTTTASRELYEEIKAGLIKAMSFAFVVEKDEYDRSTHTRTITGIKKVYDVSAVSFPANPSTDIAARSFVEGVLAEEAAELQRAEAHARQKQKIQILLEV